MLKVDNIYKLDLHDSKTWQLFAEGRTIGVFQLEKPLGRTYSKKLKPENMDQLAALTALLRPGCLACKDDDGVSMTDHYIKRKNGLEDVSYYHDSLKSILSTTYGIMTYQEQMMRIVAELAGFDKVEVDRARKAAGKKSAQEMSDVSKLFIEKAKERGIVNEEQAKQIIDWIKESARYLFNASHAYSYAYLAYVHAYLKANYPIHFYKGWLENSDNGPDSQQTIAELVEDAKYLDIEVLPPCIINSQDKFSIKDGKIWFGLGNIKGVGEAQVRKVRECLSNLEKQLEKPLKDISWRELIVFSDIPNGTLINFINAGVFRHFGNRRKQMAFQAKNFVVTDKQLEWMREHFYEHKSNLELLEAAARIKKEGGACHDKRGVSKLLSIVDIYKNPPIDMKDYPDEIADLESDLLGVALTCSRLDKFNANQSDTNIKDFLRGKKAELMVFAIELKEAREYTITKGESEGRTMAFCKVCDQTGSCDMVAFSDVYDLMQEEDLAYEGAKLLVAAKPSQKNDGSLIIERIKELKVNV